MPCLIVNTKNNIIRNQDLSTHRKTPRGVCVCGGGGGGYSHIFYT